MTEGSSDKLAISNKCDNATQKSDEYTKRNYLDISISAIASVRSIAVASIINGFLTDLIKAGHSHKDDQHLVCDSKKVFRAKERAMNLSMKEENGLLEKI